MERRRNALYQRWLLRRLVKEVSQDPGGLAATDQRALRRALGLGSIRAFDAAVTAPRWGYPSVGAYYAAASPLPTLLAFGAEASRAPLPPLLLLQAADDPWVPPQAMEVLAAQVTGLPPESPAMGRFPSLLLSPGGGHNGFHGQGDGRYRHEGTWADRAVATWLVHHGQRSCVAAARETT
jgi:predicted alpha/beta-fold hydrolase